MTDAELEKLRQAMREQRSEIRAELEDRGVDVSAWSTTPVDETDQDRDTARSD